MSEREQRAKAAAAAEEASECSRCERSARSGCVSTCDPAQGPEGTTPAPAPPTTCWSPPSATPPQPPPTGATTPATSARSAPVDADLELYALQTHLTPQELQMLALLEMSGPLLRSECARCRLKAQGALPAPEKAEGPPCICQTLADDHFFRDARAALARQLRELARRRMAAAGQPNVGNISVIGDSSIGDGCMKTPIRSESEFGDEWDWLTQMHSCVPSPLPARDTMNGQPQQQQPQQQAQQQMGSRPQFMAPRGASESGWAGFSGSATALPGGPYGAPQGFQSQQPYGQPFCPSPPQQQQQQQPPPYGLGGTFGQLPGQSSFSSPPPGQGGTYGQPPGQGAGGYGQGPAPGQGGGGFGQPPAQGSFASPGGQASNFGQPPGQGAAFGQQPPGQSGSYSANPGQGPSYGQSPAQGAGYGQPGQGGAFGQMGSGQPGQYMGQEQFMGGQFTANQYSGMTVQAGYSAPPGYGASQPYSGGGGGGGQQQYPQAQFLPAQYQPAQFSGPAPNQCTYAVQQPMQQFLTPHQGPCGISTFLPATAQLCPHLLCGAQVL